jgi:hypothetical protein
MIYEVTTPAIPGALAKFRVNDQGVVRSVYLEGSDMIAEMHSLMEPSIKAIDLLKWDAMVAALHQSGRFRFIITEHAEAKVLPTNEKIALWCRLYEQFKGIKYKVSPADSGKMKTLSINEELLTFYLDDKALPENATTWLFRGKQSIANLVKYQNEVRAAMAKPSDSRFPDHYSAEFERKLDGPGITEYRKHLMGLGLVPKRARDNTIIDFIRP